MNFPLDLPVSEFQIPAIEPIWLPEYAPRDKVCLKPSLVYPAGTLIGELTATPGTFAPYAGGSVSGYTGLVGGSGYTSNPTVTIGALGGTGAQAIAYVSSGAVVAIVVTNPGEGYVGNPSVTLTAVSGGSGATATATVVDGGIVGITVTAAGSGYLAAPTVSFTDATGVATATATETSGAVTSLTITQAGSGFIGIPTISFSGGGGANAAATAVLSYATDGSQIPVAILNKSVATDANGMIWDGLVAGVSQFGESSQTTDAFFGGYFLSSQLPNVDLYALGQMGGHVCRGSLAAGTGIIKF